MKKIYSILFATAVAALAMVSCQKKELAAEVNENEVVETPIHFYATEIATKTVFSDLSAGEYPTLWTDSKNIKISYNEKASVEATVTPKNGGVEADFTPSETFTPEGASHVFYALSPATAQVSKINTGFNSWNIEIPTNQTPLAGSVDEAAQVLMARYDAGTTFPSSVAFVFHHVTAYGKLSFANLALDGDENVTGVTLTAQSNWVGRWYYYVEDYDAEPQDGNPENEAGTVAPSSASKTISLVTTSATDIWFACAPVDLRSKTLTAIVTTNKGTFTKEITFPADKGNFQAGHVASFAINMSGVPRVSPVVYTEVTDVASLTIGSEIIITNATSTYAAGQRGSGAFLPQQAVTVSESKISDPSSSVEVYTIDNGNIAGTYSLQNASDSKYLTWSSGSSLTSSASLTDAASWAIVISGGTTTIRNMSDNTRYLLYHTSNSRFTTYLSTTEGVADVKIWKKSGTGSGAIDEKTEQSIAVSGATTKYSVNDSYSFDGTVTLTYSDLSTRVLASSEYTVDDSDVNMAVAGAYTVYITYGGLNTSYSINVGGGSYTLDSDAIKAAHSADWSYTSGSKTITATDGSSWTAYNTYGKKDQVTVQMNTGKSGYVLTPTVSGNITKITIELTSSSAGTGTGTRACYIKTADGATTISGDKIAAASLIAGYSISGSYKQLRIEPADGATYIKSITVDYQ